MRPRLFTIATLLSAALGAAVLMAIVATYWRVPSWSRAGTYTEQSEVAGSWERRYEESHASFMCGVFWYTYIAKTYEGLPHEADGSPHAYASFDWVPAPDFDFAAGWLEFDWVWGTYDDGDYRDVRVPVWPLSLVCAALPVAWSLARLRRARRGARVRRGQCAHCAYDLRASRERCPECGTAVVASSSS